MSNSLWPHGLQPTRLLCPWNSPGKNTGVGSHPLLRGIFPTQGSKPGLPHCRPEPPKQPGTPLLACKQTWTPQERKVYYAIFTNVMQSLGLPVQIFPTHSNLEMWETFPFQKACPWKISNLVCKYISFCAAQLHEHLIKPYLLPRDYHLTRKPSLLSSCLSLGIWGWWRDFKGAVLINHHVWRFKTSSHCHARILYKMQDLISMNSRVTWDKGLNILLQFTQAETPVALSINWGAF